MTALCLLPSETIFGGHFEWYARGDTCANERFAEVQDCCRKCLREEGMKVAHIHIGGERLSPVLM